MLIRKKWRIENTKVSLKSWNDKEEKPLTEVLYLVKIFFKTEGKIKTFSYHWKQKESITKRPTPQEMLKEDCLGWKVTPDGNLDVQEGINSTRNHKYMGKFLHYFSVSL